MLSTNCSMGWRKGPKRRAPWFYHLPSDPSNSNPGEQGL